MKILEEDERNHESAGQWSRNFPLTYRISIKIDDSDIILKREYFYTGFRDGEAIDDFYFDFEISWSRKLSINYATFLTRNFDEKFLAEKEKELIKKFYKKLIKSEINLKKELQDQTEDLNKSIKKYQDYQRDQMFMKIVRKKKLKKIK